MLVLISKNGDRAYYFVYELFLVSMNKTIINYN